MSEKIKKYCYNCGKDILEAYKTSKFCPNCRRPLKVKDDKIGFLTYAEDYIKGKAKSTAFSKTYDFAKNFFLSKIASYFLVIAVTVSGVATTNNIVTLNKNKEYVKDPTSIIKEEPITFINIGTAIYENEEIKEEIKEEKENKEVVPIETKQEPIKETIYEETPKIETSGSKWDNIMNNYSLYADGEEYNPNLFENEPVSGPLAEVINSHNIDLGSSEPMKEDGKIVVYFYFDDGDWSNNDGDQIFAKLTMVDHGDYYSIVSDEESNKTFEELNHE